LLELEEEFDDDEEGDPCEEDELLTRISLREAR